MSDAIEMSDDAAAPAAAAPPRTVNLVIAAVAAQAFFLLVRVVAMFGFGDQLQRLLIKSNRDLKVTDKNRKPLDQYVFNSHPVLHDLHTLRINGLWQGIILALALVLLALSLRRPSTATVTRWALLIVMVITASPFQVIPAHGWPLLIQVALVASGLMSIVAIFMLFMPDSRAYFRAIGDARRAEYAARNGRAPMPAQDKPSLRSMLTGRPTVSLDKPAARDELRAAQRGARSKSRVEADAVARGAQLARERAKSSKSRRTDSA